MGSAIRSVHGLSCVNAAGLWVQSSSDILCVECNLLGYLLSADQCNCTALPPNSNPDAFCNVLPLLVSSVTTTCGTGFCRDDDGVCVLSSYGVRCQECGLGGFIIPNPNQFATATTICSCYNSEADPYNECAVVINTHYVASYNQTTTNVTCIPYQNAMLGYYANAYECLEPYIGPPPNQGLEGECNTYGGPDPNQPNAGFFTCSNHGNWDAAGYACSCFLGWQLSGVTCSVCTPNYGPVPNYGSPPFCSVIWTPDPNDGVRKECSGHGLYDTSHNICMCFQDFTNGFWQLEQFENVQTCLACQFPYIGVNCTVNSGMTRAPTQMPTSSPSSSPSSSPTLSPVTFQPSAAPTLSPSRAPVVNNSRAPSISPSIGPALPTPTPTRSPIADIYVYPSSQIVQGDFLAPAYSSVGTSCPAPAPSPACYSNGTNCLCPQGNGREQAVLNGYCNTTLPSPCTNGYGFGIGPLPFQPNAIVRSAIDFNPISTYQNFGNASLMQCFWPACNSSANFPFWYNSGCAPSSSPTAYFTLNSNLVNGTSGNTTPWSFSESTPCDVSMFILCLCS